MKTNILTFDKSGRLLCLFVAITLLLTGGLLNSALAVTAEEIDKRADEALVKLYEVEGGKEWADKAQGLLVLPKVGKGALIVGFEHGRFIHVPIPTVVASKKRMEVTGDLWRAVLQVTGQPRWY